MSTYGTIYRTGPRGSAAIQAIRETPGVAVGESGYVWNTEDGGVTWMDRRLVRRELHRRGDGRPDRRLGGLVGPRVATEGRRVSPRAAGSEPCRVPAPWRFTIRENDLADDLREAGDPHHVDALVAETSSAFATGDRVGIELYSGAFDSQRATAHSTCWVRASSRVAERATVVWCMQPAWRLPRDRSQRRRLAAMPIS